MIKINLLGEGTVTDYSKHLVLGGYITSLVVAALVCLVANSWIASEIDELSLTKESLEQDLKRLQQTTQEVKDIEKKQKDLEERLIRIAMLKRNKQGPVKILDGLNVAVPERAWINEIREKGGHMKISGYAIDGETVSAFLRELEKSEHFPKVELDVTRQSTKQGVKIQEFVVKADVSYGGRVLNLPQPAADGKTPPPAKDK